jgi:hypothetical protein
VTGREPVFRFQKGTTMNSIIYIVGLIVIVLAVLSLVGIA